MSLHGEERKDSRHQSSDIRNRSNGTPSGWLFFDNRSRTGRHDGKKF